MVKRYEVCEQNGNGYEIEDGEWVLYEDYEKLEKENEELKEKIEKLNNLATSHILCHLSRIEEIEKIYKYEILRLNDYIEKKDNIINKKEV